jgi:hypothetical protein
MLQIKSVANNKYIHNPPPRNQVFVYIASYNALQAPSGGSPMVLYLTTRSMMSAIFSGEIKSVYVMYGLHLSSGVDFNLFG